MESSTPYWRRRFKYAKSSTWVQFHRRLLIIDLVAIPIVIYGLAKMYAFIDRGLPISFTEWLAEFPRLGEWTLFTLPSAIIILFVHGSINWARAPGRLDQKVREKAADLDAKRLAAIEALKDENKSLYQRIESFEKRLRPNIWIAGKVYRDSPIADVYADGGGMNVGLTLENRGDRELHEVRVELVKMEFAFPDTYTEEERFLTYEDMGRITKFPIILEWSPDEQISNEISCITIPAGTSRLIGLFSETFILSASHDIRPNLGVSSSLVYRVAVQVSARCVPAITSCDYVISRINRSGVVVRVAEIPYEIEPNEACELINSRVD